MAKLLVQESAGVREFELVDNEVGIGRELDNALRLADPSISRHHAVVRRAEFGYEIQDLGSSNGVLLNGAKVQSSPLKDGDRITLGQMQMTFMDPQVAEAPAEEPVSPLGTVRMSPQEMARVHGAPEGPSETVPMPTMKSAAPAAAPKPSPAPPPESLATAVPGHAPAFGQFTNPGGQVATNPAPAFLQPWLPPVPDDAQPVMAGDLPEKGDFFTRLVAHLIDCAPLVGIIVIFFILGFLFAMVPPLACIAGCALTIAEILVCLGYTFFFLPWCWSNFGATPGKKIMKLRVVPEDNPYGRIDLGTAYLRLLGHICNFTFLYLLILGPDRKAMQDYISKSICIKVDR